MIHVTKCRALDQIFTYIRPDKTVVHYNATQLREWAFDNPQATERRVMLLTPELIHRIENTRGIEEWYLTKINYATCLEPILSVAMGDGSSLTIDGHHRAVWLFRRGIKEAGVLEVSQETAGKFEVDFTGFEVLAMAGVESTEKQTAFTHEKWSPEYDRLKRTLGK